MTKKKAKTPKTNITPIDLLPLMWRRLTTDEFAEEITELYLFNKNVRAPESLPFEAGTFVWFDENQPTLIAVLDSPEGSKINHYFGRV